MKKKLLLSSILSIVMCFSLICGATFALFTSEDKVNIAVTSGTVNVVAEIEDNVKLYTFDVLQQNGKWATGGDAVVTDGNLTLNRIMPGDKAIANIKITNNSNVDIQYAMGFKVNGVLAKYLEVSTIANDVYTPVYEQSRWFMLEANGTIDTIKVAVELPEEVEAVEAMGASANIEFFISAVQGNAGPVTLPNGITEESFAANNAEAAMIDSNGNAVYFATMNAAIEKAHEAVKLNGASTMSATEKTSTGTIIYCNPYEDLGTVNHIHVCQDLTIYGNGAYISGGERDFEVDTYKKDCNGLTSDITLNIYNLGGAAVWGTKNTEYTININMQGCDDVSKIYVQGTKGTININMDDCSYDGANGYKNTAVYTNCPGTINISNTTFKGYAIAINQNNKSEGVQNINLTNCEFIDCATAQIATAENATGYAAPVRVIASAYETAVSNLNMTDCKFTYSEGNSAVNGDILTYDGRENQKNNGTVYVNGVKQVVVQPWEDILVMESDITREYMIAEEYIEINHKKGNLTLKNITFKNGLTIYTNNVSNNGTVTLENCTIYLNDGNLDPNNPDKTQAKADYGLNLNLKNGSDITFVFKNCTFTAADDHEYTGSNSYNVYIGGGYSANSITFEGCTFERSGKHGIGCSSEGSSQYYTLSVTGCNFKNWNNNSTFTNGAAIRGNLPTADFVANVTISGNTFGNNNGSTQNTVAIDSWTGSWN